MFQTTNQVSFQGYQDTNSSLDHARINYLVAHLIITRWMWLEELPMKHLFRWLAQQLNRKQGKFVKVTNDFIPKAAPKLRKLHQFEYKKLSIKFQHHLTIEPH